MLRLVLVMHKPLASAFAECARHILASAPDLVLFEIDAADSPEQRQRELEQLLLSQPGTGTVVLCDVYGATPFNIARKAVETARNRGFEADLITGANLCMVLKSLTHSRDNLQQFSQSVRRSASQGIVSAFEVS